MIYRLAILLIVVCFCGRALAAPPLSAESRRVQQAYEALQAQPGSKAARLQYLQAFPASKAEFLRIFNSFDGSQLYETSFEHIGALKRVAGTYPHQVLRKCFAIGKSLRWDADAVGDLQSTTVQLGGIHPQAFAAEARRLSAPERLSLFCFLADAENHRAYPEYVALMKSLSQTGAADLAGSLQQAKERRQRQRDH